MNKAIITGRLTKSPEVRYTQSGTAVASFTVAVEHYVKDGDNTADFIQVVVWNKLAEICGNNLDKGRKVLVEGRIQTRSYDGKDGIKRYVTEVIAQNIEFLDYRKEGQAQQQAKGAGAFGSEVVPDEEQIPF